MPIKWTNTNKASQGQGINCLVYGAAGVGKTTLCATAPKPVIVSAEGGMLSLRKQSIPVLDVSSVQDIYDVLNMLKTDTKARQHFETVCWDSISETAEIVLANAKRKSKDPRQAYGALIDEMIPLAKEFRDLQGFHTIVTCKEKVEKNELSGAMLISPQTPGQSVGSQLPYLFDEVLHLNVGKTAEGETFRYLRTQPDMNTVAKDRSGALEEISPPDLNYLFTLILT